MHIKSGLYGPGERDAEGHLIHRRGRAWADGPPNRPTILPEDVRLPTQSNGISQYNGHRYKTLDKLACHIDTTPSEIGNHPEADVFDQSRHNGLDHYMQSHPHANSPRFEPSVGLLGRGHWVPDGQGGYRAIDILSVTIPHDCANHLPEGDSL